MKGEIYTLARHSLVVSFEKLQFIESDDTEIQ